MLGTSRTPPRASPLAKLSNLTRQVTKNPNGQFNRASEVQSWVNLLEGQPSQKYCNNQGFMVLRGTGPSDVLQRSKKVLNQLGKQTIYNKYTSVTHCTYAYCISSLYMQYAHIYSRYINGMAVCIFTHYTHCAGYSISAFTLHWSFSAAFIISVITEVSGL